MPHLAHIAVYPVKSLGPVSVRQARIVEGGGLEHDREFALFDTDGKFVNAKRTARFHFLTSSVDWKDGVVTLHDKERGHSAAFHLHRDREALGDWLSDFFGLEITVQQNARGGFPDDLKAPGPTLIGGSTLAEVASWFDDGCCDDMRIRFRANLEIAGAPPFWEDHLYGEPDTIVAFRIGRVLFHGTNPCQRCVVPTRTVATGVVESEFSQIFRQRREATLPAWATTSRFNHYYRLAVNTRVPESEVGKSLHVGDEVEIL